MKKFLVKPLLTFAFATILHFSFAQSFDLEKEKAALIQADKAWALAANTNDMKKLWSFWDDDAIMLMSTDFSLTGKDQIKNFTTNTRKDPNFEINWELKGAGVSPSAEMGYTFGNGTVKRSDENGNLISSSKPYLVVWIKDEDNQWKAIIEN